MFLIAGIICAIVVSANAGKNPLFYTSPSNPLKSHKKFFLLWNLKKVGKSPVSQINSIERWFRCYDVKSNQVSFELAIFSKSIGILRFMNRIAGGLQCYFGHVLKWKLGTFKMISRLLNTDAQNSPISFQPTALLLQVRELTPIHIKVTVHLILM